MGTELKPRADAWSEEDLASFPESPCREELIDGVMIVNPPPATPHQMASSELWASLRAAAPVGFTVIEAVGVRLSGGSLLIPDLVVVRLPPRDAWSIGVHRVADVALAVELVSPGSHSLDRLTKPALYAQAGIPNFWRVELDQGPLVLGYRLSGENYVEAATGRPGKPFTLAEPFPISFDPALLLPGEAGRPQSSGS